MLNQIKGFFERHLLPGSAGQQDEEYRLRLAVAALLLEMTHMDEPVLAQERTAVEEAIRERFGLTPEEARDLVALAEAERHGATDYFQFTTLINDHYSLEQRAELVGQLWRIAYADASLHRYEEHLVRKLAQLLHVPHESFIAARHRAEPGAD